MPKLSSAGWIAHDLGLAAAIGGALFGRVALDPALHQIKNAKWRDKVNEDAWHRYGPISLTSHAAIAVPWLIGRLMLSGKEVSPAARSMTRAKDILVGVSVVTVVASALLGRLMAKRKGPEEAKAEHGKHAAETKPVIIDRTLDAVGLLNLAANVGVMGLTAALAMEGSESKSFAAESQDLP